MTRVDTSERPGPTQVTYTSDEVNIPDEFLVQKPHDAQPIILNQIDFKKTPLPEYDGCFAVLLENVLSPSECGQLTQLAEESARSQGWKPALLNMGQFETLATDVRDSDRIIWDSPELVGRLWKRCLEADGFEDKLGKISGDEHIQGPRGVKRGDVWKFTKLNERMRFLRYGPGQYFERHCDGSYVNPNAAGMERSLLTMQIYLTSNDGVKGGATTFHPRGSVFSGGGREYRVEPVLGRVIIFQQRELVHSGETLRRGSKTKITMRTDLMYELL